MTREIIGSSGKIIAFVLISKYNIQAKVLPKICNYEQRCLLLAVLITYFPVSAFLPFLRLYFTAKAIPLRLITKDSLEMERSI